MLQTQTQNRQNQQQSPQAEKQSQKQENRIDSPLQVFDQPYEQSFTLERINLQPQMDDEKSKMIADHKQNQPKYLDNDQSSLSQTEIMKDNTKDKNQLIIVQEKQLEDSIHDEGQLASVNTDEEQWYSHKFKEIQYRKKIAEETGSKQNKYQQEQSYMYLQNPQMHEPHYALANLSINTANCPEKIKFYEQSISQKSKDLILTVFCDTKLPWKYQQRIYLPFSNDILSMEAFFQSSDQPLVGLIVGVDKICKNNIILYDQRGKKSGSANLLIKSVAGTQIQTFQTLDEIEEDNQEDNHVNINTQSQETVNQDQIKSIEFSQAVEPEKLFTSEFQEPEESCSNSSQGASDPTAHIDSFPKLDERTLFLIEEEGKSFNVETLISRKVKNISKNYDSSDQNREKSDDEPKQEDIFHYKSAQEQISSYRHPFSPGPLITEQKKANLFNFDFIRKPINSIVSQDRLNSINLSICLDKNSNTVSAKPQKEQIIEQKVNYGMNTQEQQKESRNIRSKHSYCQSQKLKQDSSRFQRSIEQTVPHNLEETKRKRVGKLFQKLNQSSSLQNQQVIDLHRNHRQNENSTAIFCDEPILSRQKASRTYKSFDLMIKNININLHRKIYGRKYPRISINQTVYQAECLNGNNLLWSQKGYIFKKITIKDILHLQLFNEKSQASENIGTVSIEIKQLLLANKQSYFQTFLINERQIAAVALLGFQIVKKSYSLPSKVHNFPKIEDSRYIYNHSESMSRKKYQRRLSNATKIDNKSKILPSIDHKSHICDDQFYGRQIESKVNPIRIKKYIGGKNIKIPRASRFMQKNLKQQPGPGEYEIESSFSRHTLKQL